MSAVTDPDSSVRAKQAAGQGVSALPLPAIVFGKVHHVRHRPLRYAFTHSHHQWLVDLAVGTTHRGALRRFTDVHPRDHLGGPTSFAGLRAQVVAEVARHGVDTESIARVVLLAHARVLGHVFDPLSTYFCLAEDGSLVAAVLEVRNTYAGRHCYVVTPDRSGRAEVAKDFVVSPFNDTSGRYAVRLELSATRVATSIALSADGIPLLSAATWGEPVPATPVTILRTALSAPLMTQRVSLLIRWHGVRLWARRLPILTPKESRG